MTDTNHTIPTVQSDNRVQNTHEDVDPIDALVREFGREAGTRVGNALADEIHDDPDVRRAVATGAGVGFGVVIGLALLDVATQ